MSSKDEEASDLARGLMSCLAIFIMSAWQNSVAAIMVVRHVPYTSFSSPPVQNSYNLCATESQLATRNVSLFPPACATISPTSVICHHRTNGATCDAVPSRHWPYGFVSK